MEDGQWSGPARKRGEELGVRRLQTIGGPADVRAMSHEQLTELAVEPL